MVKNQAIDPIYQSAAYTDFPAKFLPRLLHSRQAGTMRILGIDCGGEYTGYGVVEQDDDTRSVTFAAGRSGYCRENRWKFG